MNPPAADAVMEAVKSAPENEAMQGRWSDSAEGYPPAIFILAWMSAKEKALEWIDANCPKAWYRPMFTE